MVGVVYRSPSSTDADNSLIEATIESVMNCEFQHFLLMGDFNFPEIDWISCVVNAPGHPAERFLTCVQDLFLCQHVLEATHHRPGQTSNVLDLVLTNDDHLVHGLQYTEPIGKSDHVSLTWSVTCYQYRPTTQTVKYCYDKGDYTGMKKFLSDINFEEKLRNLSVEDMWSVIKGRIHEAVSRYVPSYTAKDGVATRLKKPPWMNSESKIALRQKKRAYNLYLVSREGSDYTQYARLRNKAKAEVRKAVRNYEKEIAGKAKRNPKAFYRYVNGKMKGRGTIPDLKNDDGTVVSENRGKADAFSQFFSSVFTGEDLCNTPDLPGISVKQSLSDISFTEVDVLKLLRGLKPDKSPGPDMIHPQLLKECAEELAFPLFVLYRLSLDEGELPQDWKKGHISP